MQSKLNELPDIFINIVMNNYLNKINVCGCFENDINFLMCGNIVFVFAMRCKSLEKAYFTKSNLML